MRRRASSTPRWICSSSRVGRLIQYEIHTNKGTPTAVMKATPIIKSLYTIGTFTFLLGQVYAAHEGKL
jgi:hypothetical protein